MPNLTNRECRAKAINLTPFKNGNKTIYGEWADSNTYVVYSYGSHFPIYAWVRQTNRWYANEDKYSRTTTRHMGQVCPDHNATRVSTGFLKSLAIQGFAAIAAQRVVYGEIL